MIKTNKTITLENVLDNTKKRQNLIYKDLTKKKKVGYFLLKKNLNDLNKTIENNLTKNRSVFYYELNNGDQKEKTEFELDVDIKDYTINVMHANDYIFNSKLVHERYCSLLKEHYMTSDVLNKKDLRKIYKKILSEDLYGISVSKG